MPGITIQRPGPGAPIIPAGLSCTFCGTSAPTGWLMCDGASYLRSTYPDLFAVIGTSVGAADGTHFNVPDFRGRFLRGVDNGAGRDPDAAGRTAMATGGNIGDNVGSIQADAFDSHVHDVKGSRAEVSVNNRVRVSGLGSASFFPGNDSEATGGNETRPINAYVNHIIKT